MRELEGLTSGEPMGDARSLASSYFEKKIACPFLADESCGRILLKELGVPEAELKTI